MSSGPQVGQPTFASAHFDSGADFFRALFANGARFDNAQATGPLDFEGATFNDSTSFVHARFFSDADFSDRASFRGLLKFDEAELSALNLDSADLSRGHVYLPGSHKAGHLDSLRMDPADVRYVSVVGKKDDVRKQREHTLAMIENAARAGGDLGVAAQAGVRRLTLGRRDDDAVLRAFDWLFWWQISGYFLRPWHPFWALVITIVFFALLKEWLYERETPRRQRFLNFFKHLWQSATAIKPRQTEATTTPRKIVAWLEPNVHRLLVAVLLLTVANVWPPVAGILKGVLT